MQLGAYPRLMANARFLTFLYSVSLVGFAVVPKPKICTWEHGLKYTTIIH